MVVRRTAPIDSSEKPEPKKRPVAVEDDRSENHETPIVKLTAPTKQGVCHNYAFVGHSEHFFPL
jgi:hypothetical protein